MFRDSTEQNYGQDPLYLERHFMKYDAIIDKLPIYVVSSSAKLGYGEKESWMKLDWNESPRNASPKVINAIIQFLSDHSLSYYPDVTSNGLISAISEKYDIPDNFISVFNGSDNALQHIFYAFLTKDSVFTTVKPTYTQILQFVHFKDPKIRYYSPRDVLNIDLPFYEKDYIAGADVVYVINPNNPIGNLLSKDYLLRLSQKFPGTLFIIDEAYMEFASTDESCISLVSEQRNIIVTRTFSKAYGLAGIRLGFAVSHKDNIDVIQMIKNNKDINTLAQIAGEAAVRDTEYLTYHVREINRTKKWFLDNVPSAYSTIGSEANFVLLNYKNDPGLIERLEMNKVLVRDRSDQHGLENFLRITIGTEDQMRSVAAILSDGRAGA
jgi:histidinol-phosphate aminotransferase